MQCLGRPHDLERVLTGSGVRGGDRLDRRSGRDEDEDRGADFVDVVCFGRQAEVCANYLGKGRRIAVEGRLHHDEWDGENGRRQKLEVIAQSVEFLDSKRTGGEASEEAEAVAA